MTYDAKIFRHDEDGSVIPMKLVERSEMADFLWEMFWNPENDNETIGDIKKTLRKKYRLNGPLEGHKNKFR